jgi:hypothetical protein
MIAPITTLAFLSTLWLLVVVGAAALEDSGAKIIAALRGKPMRQFPGAAPMRNRIRRVQQPMPGCASSQPAWRAAA